MSSSSSNGRSQALAVITKVAHVPAPFLGAFLAVHLSAPVVATIGGSSMSSSVMLLGREYYQGIPQEYIFLFGPLALHIGAAALKRILSPSPRTQPRPVSNPLTVSGLATLALMIPHIFTHRIIPKSPSYPISSLGPSQLDFSFVQRALQKFPMKSILGYGLLTGAAILHWTEGVALLYDMYVAEEGEEKRWAKRRVRQRRVIWTVGGALIAGGLWALWKEPIAMPLPSLLARYDAVLDRSILYR